MFRSVALFIALRYTKAKQRNHFISFISMVSMIGIALGVMVLITVLSVMNGFDKEIKQRVFGMVPPITVSHFSGLVDNWQELSAELQGKKNIIATAPYINGEVLLSFGASVQPAMLNGVLPDKERQVIDIPKKMVQGQFSDLKDKSFGIVLGENLAVLLGAGVGDKVTVVTPQMTLSPAGVMPRFKRFKVVGIFRAGNGFGFDRGLGFINLNDAQRLFGLGHKVSGVHAKIENVFAAPRIALALRHELPFSADVTTWADQFGEFFHAVQLEKTMMFLILMLIIAVAAFNLVSTLVMVVNEKHADIAILRTFGATPSTITWIFVLQGSLVGIIGTFLGLVGGVLLASNVTTIVNWIEAIFHVQFLSSNVYFVDYLPSQIQWKDVLQICVASLLLSIVATIYPARRAAKMDPVESLRYE